MVKRILLTFNIFVMIALVASCNSNDSFYLDENIEFDDVSEINVTAKTDSNSDYAPTSTCFITSEENLFEDTKCEMDNVENISENDNYIDKSFFGYLGDELFVSEGELIEDDILLFENLAYGSMLNNKSEWFIIKEGDTFGDFWISDVASTYSMNANEWILENEIMRIEGRATLTGVISYVPDGSLPAYETSGHEVFFLADMQSFVDSGMPILYGGISYLPTLNNDENFSNETPLFSLGLLSDYKEVEGFEFLDDETIYVEIVVENITMVSGFHCATTASVVSVELLS